VAPLSYEAWVDYDLESRPLTRVERQIVSKLVEEDSDEGLASKAGGRVSAAEMKEAGLSKREVEELVEKLEAPEHPDFELDTKAMCSADEMAAKMYEAVPNSFE
jgi:hypothetical protein